jgi:hypothetical protein
MNAPLVVDLPVRAGLVEAGDEPLENGFSRLN